MKKRWVRVALLAVILLLLSGVTVLALAAPTITISAATLITGTTATLNGDVTDTGGDNPTVTVYWGTVNGLQVVGNWQNSAAPTSPSQPQGATSFYYNVPNLALNTLYYFSAAATNSTGTSWPVASLSFTTLAAASIPAVTASPMPNIIKSITGGGSAPSSQIVNQGIPLVGIAMFVGTMLNVPAMTIVNIGAMFLLFVVGFFCIFLKLGPVITGMIMVAFAVMFQIFHVFEFWMAFIIVVLIILSWLLPRQTQVLG